MTGLRISRPCYDKPHRCPGWAGGGTRGAKVDRCDGGGSLARVMYYKRETIDPPLGNGEFEHARHWQWRFNSCPDCGVVVLPFAVRWTSPRYWGWKIRSKISDLKYERYQRRT